MELEVWVDSGGYQCCEGKRLEVRVGVVTVIQLLHLKICSYLCLNHNVYLQVEIVIGIYCLQCKYVLIILSTNKFSKTLFFSDIIITKIHTHVQNHSLPRD